MRAGARLLLLLSILFVMGATLPEPDMGSESPESALRRNRHLWEEWSEDPVRAEQLRRRAEAFWTLPKGERDRLRRLDQQLHELPLPERERLWQVMERYHAWLQRLTTEDRRHIEEAPDRETKLQRIRELREKQWIRRLPTEDQERLAALEGEAREEELHRLRELDREWQERWLPEYRPKHLEDFSGEVQSYVREVLLPLLSPEQRAELQRAEGQPWPHLARVLLRISKGMQAPMPGRVGPRYLRELPASFDRLLTRLSPERMASLREVEGKWPDFMERVLEVAPPRLEAAYRKRLLPSKPDEFSRSVERFIETELMSKLSDQEKKRLREAEGNWPAYPKTVQELADRHKLEVPGTKLPGSPEEWRRAMQSGQSSRPKKGN